MVPELPNVALFCGDTGISVKKDQFYSMSSGTRFSRLQLKGIQTDRDAAARTTVLMNLGNPAFNALQASLHPEYACGLYYRPFE